MDTERVIDPNKPMVALTFDDGPSAYYTPMILDVLEKNNAAATFFVLGIQAEQKPEVLKRIVEEGNEIGIHSYDHPDLTMLPYEVVRDQLDKTSNIVTEATGFIPVIMRPPFGRRTEELIENIYMPIILWSIDTYDWQNQDVEVIYNTIFENVKDGDIILMHDIFETSAEAAALVIPELIKRGFQLVTISEMSQYKGVPLLPSNVYFNFYQ